MISLRLTLDINTTGDKDSGWQLMITIALRINHNVVWMIIYILITGLRFLLLWEELIDGKTDIF